MADGEGGGSTEWLPIFDRVEAMASKSQAEAEALAADRARLEAADRVQRQSLEAVRRLQRTVEELQAAVREKDGEIDRLRAEAADARKKLQADACKKMRWEAAYVELLLGANQKLAELRDCDLEDSRTRAETPNSEEAGGCAKQNQGAVGHIASDLSGELRKLKQAYETLSSKQDKEVAALLSENDSLRSQLDIMQKDYAELLKNKKGEEVQGTEAELKLQKSVDELKVLAQKKDDEIARLQAEVVGAKKKHNKDPSALLSQKDSLCNQLSTTPSFLRARKLLKSKKVLTQKNDHELVMSRAEAVGAKKNLQLMHFFGKEKYDEIQRLNGWQVESVQKYYKYDDDCISETKAVEKDDHGHSRSDVHEHSQSGRDKETMNNPILNPPGKHKRKRDACNAETANGKSHGEINGLRDMPELVKFVVYYGPPGTVRSNERGVDLSEFAHLRLQLPPGAETVSISQMKYWFTTYFSLDPEISTMSIQAVWSKSSSSIFWKLKKIDRTSHWVSWLEECKRRRTHPVALVLAMAKENPFVEVDSGYRPGQGI